MANGNNAAERFAPQLPAAVQAQGDKAKALQATMAQGTPVPAAEPVRPAPTEPGPTPTTPTPQHQGVTPTPPPGPAPVPQPQPIHPQPQGEDWQARYNVLQGKYNAEVPGLQRALAEANATINHAP